MPTSPAVIATSTTEPAKLIGEIEPLETLLEPNGQVRYNISVQNIGSRVAENVIVEIQLPPEVTLTVPQPLDWQRLSDDRQQKIYQLVLGSLSPQATVQRFVLLEAGENVDAGQTILTPALH